VGSVVLDMGLHGVSRHAGRLGMESMGKYTINKRTSLIEQLAVPGYGAYKAYELYTGAKGMMGGSEEESTTATGTSKRQQKMEKRGNRKVVYG
jgi:hypothetical protein